MEPNTELNQAVGVQRRLNPFALPAETDSRFNLFAIAAITWVLNFAVMLWAWLPEWVYAGSGTGQADDGSGMFWFQIGMPIVTIILAIVLYVTHPQRIARRQQLQSFDKMKDPAFAQAVEELTSVAELTKAPVIRISQTKRIGGQVFGLHGRYMLRLDDSLRLVLRKAPATFRAIVLHELAHIANRDVGRTYFSQALWSATISVSVIPLLLLLGYDLIGSRLLLLLNGRITDADIQKFLQNSLPWFLFLLFQFSIGLLLVAAIRASLLRVRETHADWRVATWGNEQSLIDILKRTASGKSVPLNLKDRLHHGLRLHPTNTERVNVLQEPQRLFIMTYDIPFFVGWLTSTVIWSVFWLYSQFTDVTFLGSNALMLILESFIQNPSNNTVANFMLLIAFVNVFLMIILVIAPFLLMAYLVIQSVGIQVLHEVLHDLFFNYCDLRSYARLLLASILLIAGLYLGIATSIHGMSFLSMEMVTRIVPNGIMLFAPLIWLCLASLRYFGRWILGSHTGKQSPVWKCRVLLIMFSIALGGLFALFFVWNLGNVARYGSFATTIQDVDANLMLKMEIMLMMLFFCVVLVIFLANWGWIKLWHWLRPVCCPKCQMRVTHTCAVGQVCSSCGAELTPWLFVAKSVVA
jgi:Zn-dependent protease with chaperone function